MQDFLTFQTFVTPTLLVILYYLGAFVIPFVSYFIAKWIHSSYFNNVGSEMKKNLTLKQHVILLSMMILCFLCIEVFWRVIFEFFIAYFDMHDALMKLNSSN